MSHLRPAFAPRTPYQPAGAPACTCSSPSLNWSRSTELIRGGWLGTCCRARRQLSLKHAENTRFQGHLAAQWAEPWPFGKSTGFQKLVALPSGKHRADPTWHQSRPPDLPQRLSVSASSTAAPLRRAAEAAGNDLDRRCAARVLRRGSKLKKVRLTTSAHGSAGSAASETSAAAAKCSRPWYSPSLLELVRLNAGGASL
mmetsp:Transcript_15564/g.42032  ORF Transcript_15564/g.42032 Transcript_15564/m.42032 type:complete len:199 (+) Transcript_15564:107-703(+)